MLNQVVLVGSLAEEIEMCETLEGKAKAVFTLEVASKHGTSFIQCTVTGKTAEEMDLVCRKGITIGVNGYLDSKQYESNNQYINLIKVVAESVQYLNNING